ncbi:MAG: SirB2 family protein [Xanthomonadales bacterium]|nr:SirB2 family protein [Xanthomonadales bacterium]
MIEYYLQLKALHVGAVLASITIFAARAALALSGRVPLARHLALRILSWTVDTFLLTFALMLWTTLKLDPVVHHWLGLKLLLLVIYVGLGTQALKATQAFGPRLAWTLAALCTIAAMYGIARAHHPLGWLRWWGLL